MIELRDKGQPHFWVIVVGESQVESDFLQQGWWCFQEKARQGDFLIAYRTQRADKKNFGLFALCEITANPNPNDENSAFCSRYGKHVGELFYTKIKLVKVFQHRLSLQKMKADDVLRKR